MHETSIKPQAAGKLIWLLFVVFAVCALLSQEPTIKPLPGQDLGRARQRLQELQAQLGQVDDQLDVLKRRRQGILVELQNIALAASKARAQAEIARLELEQARFEVRSLGMRKAEILKELDSIKMGLRRQVRWLQALGPLGTLSYFPTHSDIESYLVRGRYLEWWRVNETKRLQRAIGLHAELAERERDISEAESKYSRVAIEMAALQEGLSANERRLQDYLGGIQKDEQQKKNIQAELREESIMLEKMLASVLSRAKVEGPFVASVPFQALAGHLRWPVEGTLAEGFGVQTHPRFGTKTMNTGLMITANGGAPVQSVAAGKVVMADSYQSYGLMVIIDHGGSYYTIYTHLRALAVAKGQTVASRETIGFVGDTPDGPRLGFEIRNQTTPEDPQKWLASRQRGL